MSSSLLSRVGDIMRNDTSASRRGFYDAADSSGRYGSDPELDYSGVRQPGALGAKKGGFFKNRGYSVHQEYPTQPGYGVNRGPKASTGATRLISR